MEFVNLQSGTFTPSEFIYFFLKVNDIFVKVYTFNPCFLYLNTYLCRRAWGRCWCPGIVDRLYTVCPQ